MIDMLKAKFIDKILEVMQEEADRIWIDNKEVTVYFKDSRDVEGNAEILKHIYTLKLNEVVGDYRIRIDAKDKRVKYCSAKCEKQYWREKSKADATYKKRSREKTLGMRNYSKKEMAIKLYKEKKEAEETENIGGKK